MLLWDLTRRQNEEKTNQFQSMPILILDLFMRTLKKVVNVKFGGRYLGVTYHAPDNRQWKTVLSIDDRGSKITRNSVFHCHLSPVGRLMVIKNSVSDAS